MKRPPINPAQAYLVQSCINGHAYLGHGGGFWDIGQFDPGLLWPKVLKKFNRRHLAEGHRRVLEGTARVQAIPAAWA